MLFPLLSVVAPAAPDLAARVATRVLMRDVLIDLASREVGLMSTEGLGHRRVLYDPAVADAVAAFIHEEPR